MNELRLGLEMALTYKLNFILAKVIELMNHFDLKELFIFRPGNQYWSDCSLPVVRIVKCLESLTSYLSSTKTTTTTLTPCPLPPSDKVQSSPFFDYSQFGWLECFH